MAIILEFPKKTTACKSYDEQVERGFDTTATGCKIKINHNYDYMYKPHIISRQPHLSELDADEIIETLKRIIKTEDEREILREAVARYNIGDWTDTGGSLYWGNVEVGKYEYFYSKSCYKWHRFDIRRFLDVDKYIGKVVKPLFRKKEQFKEHVNGVTAAILSCVYNAVMLEHHPENEKKPRRKKEKAPPPTPSKIVRMFERS